MTISLDVSIEGHWRGTVLDTLRPIARLPLGELADHPGSRSIGQPFELRLTNGDSVTVWCVRTDSGRYILSVSNGTRTLFRAEANAPISTCIDLPDGKQYQFSISVEA